MKKGLAMLLAIIIVSSAFGATVLAAATDTIKYYDEYGNQITVNGLYYNSAGYPMYNADCYYIGEDGAPVYVGGCRVYYYDADGNLIEGNYYYNANGSAVAKPLFLCKRGGFPQPHAG